MDETLLPIVSASAVVAAAGGKRAEWKRSTASRFFLAGRKVIYD